MNKILVGNIFAAVSDKSVLDPLLLVFDPKLVKFWGTEGTVEYLKSKDFSAFSVVAGFDFDGRVKSLDKLIFARILADRSKKSHLEELKRLTHGVIARSIATKQSIDRHVEFDSTRDDRDWKPYDLVVIDLYKPDPKNFPESMDIGGQALIRAAIKNYKNVALAFDEDSVRELTVELQKNDGSTTLAFRKKQALSAAGFIVERCAFEAGLLQKL